MKLWMVAAVLAAVASPALAQGSYSTRGYVRGDGTYVQPHRATNPDNTTANNWSTRPNVNPYTGQQGTRSATPSYGSSYGSSYGAKPKRNTYGSSGF